MECPSFHRHLERCRQRVHMLHAASTVSTAAPSPPRNRHWEKSTALLIGGGEKLHTRTSITWRVYMNAFFFFHLSLEIQNHGCHTKQLQTPRSASGKSAFDASFLKRYLRLSAQYASVTSRQPELPCKSTARLRMSDSFSRHNLFSENECSRLMLVAWTPYVWQLTGYLRGGSIAGTY
jgi:hypothetical protein